MAPTTLSSILAARAASSAAAAAGAAAQGVADRAMLLMRISDHASGMTPREGYAGWFRIVRFGVTRSDQGWRQPPADNSLQVRVARALDAMSARLHMLADSGELLRFVLIETNPGAVDLVRMRFDRVRVVYRSFDASGPLELVDFQARAVSAESPAIPR